MLCHSLAWAAVHGPRPALKPALSAYILTYVSFQLLLHFLVFDLRLKGSCVDIEE